MIEKIYLLITDVINFFGNATAINTTIDLWYGILAVGIAGLITALAFKIIVSVAT